MHPRTQATIEQLRGVEWFRNVGVRDAKTADVLSSWEEAIESCKSLEWRNLCLEAANQFCERLVERSVERFELWNEIVDVVKPHSMKLVREKTADVMSENSLPEAFLNNVDWNILHLLMEAEYYDLLSGPGAFFSGTAYWYMNGHFPCGWQGRFPEGRLVIY